MEWKSKYESKAKAGKVEDYLDQATSKGNNSRATGSTERVWDENKERTSLDDPMKIFGIKFI